MHGDTIIVESEDNPDLKMHVVCDKLYLKSDLPVMVFLPSMGEKIDENLLKKLLRKGVVVI